MKIILFCVFLIVAFVVSSNQQLSWEGEWDDNREDAAGGTLFTCVDGNKLQGTYSRIGYVVGDINGRVVNGNWYEAGFNELRTGGFRWTLNSEDIGFSGEWWYEDTPCYKFEWDAFRLESSTDRTECGVIDLETTKSMEGHWETGTEGFGVDDLYICFDDDNNKEFAYGSYFINPVGYQGYFTGPTHHDGKSGQITVWDSRRSSESIMIMKMVGEDELHTYQWNVENVSDAEGEYQDFSNTHTLTVWTRDSASSEDQCRQYENLSLMLPWTGVWTDSRNGVGRLYTCQNEDKVQGVYSELGYIDGTVSGKNNKLKGKWFQSGKGAGTSGDFEITPDSKDAFTFSGTYTIDGVPDKVFDWDENRLDYTDYEADQCYAVTDKGFSLEGQWQFGPNAEDVMDICFDGSSNLEFSYTYFGQPGYGEGAIDLDGKAAHFDYFTSSVQGIGMFRLVNPTTMYFFNYNNPLGLTGTPWKPCTTNTEINFSFQENHDVIKLTYIAATNKQNCERNELLEDITQSIFTDSFDSSDDDDSSQRVGSPSSDDDFYSDDSSANSLLTFSTCVMFLIISLVIIF
eukprot:TRINITY_DN456_c0_g1_i1.p1 TRINITY_DN456_c0_g1~~TRINITY_DN456_c0_g1_i1.p1  ORF type:complete len:571 (+),score=234.98 TRINITY_DN456_c0_g1_i1:117-1829(+)